MYTHFESETVCVHVAAYLVLICKCNKLVEFINKFEDS